MYDNFKYIKEALLNPLSIMENIMKTGFPNQAYLYINTIYFTFIDMLNINILFDKYEYVIDKILEKNGVTEENLIKLNNQNRKLDSFMSLIHIIREDLLMAYAKIGMSVETGTVGEDKILDYRKLIDNMYLDPNNIYAEFEANQIFFSNSVMWDLSVWLHESLHTLIFNMLYHDDNTKAGRVYMYVDKVSGNSSTRSFIQVFNKETAQYDKLKKDKIKTDIKRIEEDKNDKIDLPRQVNMIDKHAGCSLKHPESTLDTQYQFEVRVNKYKYALAKYLFKLNDMRLKKHINNNTIFGMEVQNIELNKKFKKLSPWFDDDEVDYTAQKYMMRFVSYIFAWVIRHLTDIAEVCYAFNQDSEYIEYESKIDYVKYTVKRTIILADKIVNNISVGDDLLYFEELMMCMESSPKTKKKVKKNVKNMHRSVSAICLDAKPFPSVAMYSQDIQMDTMVKLAYMLATHDRNMRADLAFHKNYKFRNKNETKIIIEELGRAINKDQLKNQSPPMFRYFVDANPIIESQFDDVNSNQDLATGVVAMKYLAFILNDENVIDKVERII